MAPPGDWRGLSRGRRTYSRLPSHPPGHLVGIGEVHAGVRGLEAIDAEAVPDALLAAER